jgi:hypothetical protein
MVEGRDPWEFEMKGDDLTRDAVIIAPDDITPFNKPYPMANACHKGKLDMRALANLDPADRKALEGMGYKERFNAAG